MFVKLGFVLVLLKYSNAYLHETNSSILKDINFIIPKEFNGFPQHFNLTFTYQKKYFNKKFFKRDQDNSEDIYVIDSKTRQPVKHNISEEKAGYYTLDNGEGFARLIENNDPSNPFRAFATIRSEDNESLVFDIIPAMNPKTKRSLRKQNFHMIQERRFDQPFDELKLTKKIQSRQKRAHENGSPVVLNVELLVVTDSTVYNNFQKLVGSSNNQTIFTVMRHYYAHLTNGVNQRYQLSLATDPDFKINIVLSNFLFLTRPQDQQWLLSTFDRTIPVYVGRQTVDFRRASENFVNYMNSLKFPFEYDHAVALFNMELLGGDSTTPITTRIITTGFCPGYVCTPFRYSLCEDFGGFSNLITVAHELGHSLGAVHDGQQNICAESESNIMTASVSPTQGSSHKFSACSINEFKNKLLNSSSAKGVSYFGECLLNIPHSPINQSQLTQDKRPGDFFTPDEQCKMIFGSPATFCRSTLNSVCKTLYCRLNPLNETCVPAYTGAVDGTPCDSGKVCRDGVCVTQVGAQTGTCLYGDDGVNKDTAWRFPVRLITSQMSCQNYFEQVNLYGQDLSIYCDFPDFRATCCQSCKKYQALVCRDFDPSCKNWANSCDSIVNNQTKVKDLCPRTCSVCKSEPLRCDQAPNICQNGATCVNINVNSSSLFGFTCRCTTDFSGELCETRISNSCGQNPCLNGGTCQPFGSLGYVCVCPNECSGYNCSVCVTTTTSTSTTTPTPPTTTAIQTSIVPIRTTTFISTQPITSVDSNTNTITNTELTVNSTTGISSTATVTLIPTTNIPNVTTDVFNLTTTDIPLKSTGLPPISSTDLPLTTTSANFTSTGLPLTSTVLNLTTVRTTLFLETVSDFDQLVCRYFRILGLCETNSYIRNLHIKVACGITCNYLDSFIPAPSSTTTTTPSSLTDVNSLICIYYKNLGFCNSSGFLYGRPIKQACAFSCA